MKITLKDVDLPDLSEMIKQVVTEQAQHQIRDLVAQVVGQTLPKERIAEVTANALQATISRLVEQDVRNYLATRLDAAVMDMLNSELGAAWRQRGALTHVLRQEIDKVLDERAAAQKGK